MTTEPKPITIPFMEALEVKIINRAVEPILPPMMFIDDATILPKAQEPTRHLMEYSATVTCNYRQTDDAGRETQVRERAARAIGHVVYGPILNELIGLRSELWSLGLPANHPILKRLELLCEAMEFGSGRLRR
jgi:hypothetical protein